MKPNPAKTPASSVHADLPARWWQWSESFAPSHNPIDDPDGSQCAGHQPSDVWFLAGTHGGSAVRTCTIPTGHSLYFPVINQVCEVAATESDTAARSACEGAADVATATLDGKPLRVQQAESNGSFQLISPAGSVGLPPGKHKVVAWGLWVGPLALSPGQHKVTLLGRSGQFETTVTYHLSAG